MKFLKFLFYMTYALLVYWFYTTTLKPKAIKMYEYITQRDTTIIIGRMPVFSGDTAQGTVSLVLQADNSDYAKTKYLDGIFVNGSMEYQDSKMEQSKYEERAKELQTFLYSKFSIKQLKCINHISLINWANLNNDVTGLTTGYDDNNNSYIDLPVLSSDYRKSLLHEVWHCIHNAHHKYFHDKYEYDWMAADGYVSPYAETSMDEDIAETGSFYSAGTILTGPKISIIKEFYKYTY